MAPYLARLDEGAAKLAAIEVPLLKGRGRALDGAALTMRVLGREVEHGATLLDQAGIDPESVRQVRAAARMLGSKPLLEGQVHDAARALTDAVADVRTRNADLLAAADQAFDSELAAARGVLAGIDGAPTAEQRAALAEALRFDPSYTGFSNARLHDRLIDSIPFETKVAVLRDMVGRPADELQPDELRMLGRLIQGRQWGKTGGILNFNFDPPYSSRIDEAIDGAIIGTNRRRTLELDRFLTRDVVKRMPEHERLQLATQLFSKDVSDVTPHEWNLLENLTNGDVVGYETGLVTSLPGHEAFSRHVAFRTMQGMPPSDTMYAYFDANALKGFSNAERAKVIEARFDRALDEATSGTLSKSSETLLMASWSAAADRVSQMPIERQSKIAMTLLGLPSGPSGDLEAVRVAVRAIDRDLAAGPFPDQFRTLYDETKVLIDRNIARMEGHRDPTVNRGYALHPDYAEVGRIRANAVLLRAVRDMADSARTSSPPTGAAANAAETLSW